MALNNVPLPGQNLLNTRDLISGNFNVIDAAFLVDHVDYNTAGQGKHEKVTLVNNPAPAFLAGEMGLFNQNVAPFNRPDIWVSRGIAAPYNMTGYVNNNAGATNGFTVLPSGIKIVWGASVIAAGGQVTITYSAAVPGFTPFTTWWAPPQLTRTGGIGVTNNFVCLGGFTATTLTAFSSQLGNGVNFSWLAWGI